MFYKTGKISAKSFPAMHDITHLLVMSIQSSNPHCYFPSYLRTLVVYEGTKVIFTKVLHTVNRNIYEVPSYYVPSYVPSY